MMATSVTRGGTQKLPKYFRLSKYTNMTIHWKALQEHYGTISLSSQPFFGKMCLLNFSEKNLSPKKVKTDSQTLPFLQGFNFVEHDTQ
jgi:hypothetical protein